MSSESTNNNNSSSAFRVNYSDYVADITGGPKPARPSTITGIGHHIRPLHNPYPNKPAQPTGGMPQYGGGADKCARCSKTVYVAEKKVAAGRSFHSSCFSCHTCKRKLDSSGLSEHKGEIYCRSCYTKQFGAHGLISGVTMSTEHTPTHEIRRPSYGNDLNAPGVTNQPIRQRTYSNENVFDDEYSTKQNDISPKKSPQRNNNTLPEQTSPSKTVNEGVNAIIDTNYQRSPSPSQVGDSNVNNNRHRSTYVEEDDRSKYVYEGQKLSYGSGASAVVDIPIIRQNKQTNSTIDQFELPNEPTRDHQGSRNPSVTSNDSYRRQNSRQLSTDPTDEYSRLTINENNNNPSAPPNYSYSSTYETKRQSTTSNSNNSDREQYHSRESSPTYRNRSPSPTTGYSTSSTTRTNISSILKTGTSPPPSYVPQYNYRDTEISSNYNDHRSPSPQSNNRTSSGLADFVTKTNLAGNIPPSNDHKSSTLGALVGGFRPLDKANDDSDD